MITDWEYQQHVGGSSREQAGLSFQTSSLKRNRKCAIMCNERHLQGEWAWLEVGVGQVVEVEAAQSEAHLVDVRRIKGGSRGVKFRAGLPHELPPRDVNVLPVSCRQAT